MDTNPAVDAAALHNFYLAQINRLVAQGRESQIAVLAEEYEYLCSHEITRRPTAA